MLKLLNDIPCYQCFHEQSAISSYEFRNEASYRRSCENCFDTIEADSEEQVNDNWKTIYLQELSKIVRQAEKLGFLQVKDGKIIEVIWEN